MVQIVFSLKIIADAVNTHTAYTHTSAFTPAQLPMPHQLSLYTHAAKLFASTFPRVYKNEIELTELSLACKQSISNNALHFIIIIYRHILYGFLGGS